MSGTRGLATCWAGQTRCYDSIACADVAQLVEQGFRKAQVVSSSLTVGSEPVWTASKSKRRYVGGPVLSWHLGRRNPLAAPGRVVCHVTNEPGPSLGHQSAAAGSAFIWAEYLHEHLTFAEPRHRFLHHAEGQRVIAGHRRSLDQAFKDHPGAAWNR